MNSAYFKQGDSMSELTIGVIGTSRKTDERRYPIHPDPLSAFQNNLENN
ncbi:hypothetical protein [Pseudoalteromonas prydzensis]|nr:hypothetical protein [Pseudoalteromonas prydzensis]MBE0376108.1 hypothetical protein [Pseudoalteromonas prydzensis ACAM 620]